MCVVVKRLNVKSVDESCTTSNMDWAAENNEDGHQFSSRHFKETGLRGNDLRGKQEAVLLRH